MSRITALLPSRGRAALCIEAVRNLYATASRPRDVAVIVWLDADDPQLIDVLVPLAEDIGSAGGEPWSEAHPFRIHLVIAPRYTYYGIHRAYGEMAAMAVESSDWVLFWNDDARMPPGWDDAIGERDPALPTALLTKRSGEAHHHHSAFPILSRGFVAAVPPPVGKHYATDSYVCEIAIMAECAEWVTLDWSHNQIPEERPPEFPVVSFDDLGDLRERDAAALRAYRARVTAEATP